MQLTHLENALNADPPSLTLVRPIYPLKCNPLLLTGIFARLDDSIRADLKRLAGERKSEKNRAHEFVLKWAAQELSSDEYANIQRFYLADCETADSDDAYTLKFLCFSFYLAHKIRHIVDLNLHKSSSLRILDLATGAGHFPMIAQLYGHHVIGLDLPLSIPKNHDEHLWNVLCRFFGVSKIDHKIEPMSPLPDFAEKFDLITSFIPAFNLHEDGKPWRDGPWRFFVEDTVERLLVTGGFLYMTLTEGTLSPEAWRYLRSVGEFAHDTRHIVRIRRA